MSIVNRIICMISRDLLRFRNGQFSLPDQCLETDLTFSNELLETGGCWITVHSENGEFLLTPTVLFMALSSEPQIDINNYQILKVPAGCSGVGLQS